MAPGIAPLALLGRIYQVNVSPEGGLPKRPTTGPVWVRRTGVEGDLNRYRQERLGGDPDSAVLLLTRDAIGTYAREGYPVGPGSLGENITLEDVPYDSLAVEQRWRLGPRAVVQISRPCTPCSELLAYGSDFLNRTRGRRGYCARVLEEGPVSPGDTAHLLLGP
jgi:MOSC domain-containing protein YiiM